jgi:uncharacterized protein involved in exopolysaccharide biosynthesis/Mrp family chromosome partitioning ATPase
MTAEAIDPQRAATNGPIMRVLLAGAWRHRLLILLAVCLGAVAGAFRALVIPNQYQSVGKLFVRAGIRDSLAPEAAFGVGGTRFPTPIREAIANQMHVLSAPELFDKIVERVGVDTLLKPYDPAANRTGAAPWHTALFHSLQSWWFASGSGTPQTDLPIDPQHLAALMLRSDLEIFPEPGASVITFVYTAYSPQRAQDVVNAALDSAKEFHGEVFDKMASAKAVEEEAQAEELKAAAAEKALRDYRIEKNIYDYESQQRELFDYLNSVGRLLDDVDSDTKEREAERGSLAQSLTTIPPRAVRAGSQPSSLNPIYTSLVERRNEMWMELMRLDIDETTASSKKIEDKRNKLKELIENTTKQIEQVPEQVEGIEDENPNYARVAQRLVDLDAELAGLAKRREHLVKIQEVTRGQRLELEKLGPAVRALEEDAKQKRQRADNLAASVANLETVKRLESLNLSEIQIMQRGTLESSKVAPRRGPMVMQAAVLGGVLGAMLAALLTLMDRRVRMREDLMRLGLPAGGVVAEQRGKPRGGRAASRLPESFADARADIASAWAALPFERHGSDRLRIAILPSGPEADAQRAAAVLAVGLAAHGGETVAYVAGSPRGTWLAQRLGLSTARGWSEVVRGAATLEQVELATPISGLTFLPAGAMTDVLPHPMATTGFVEVLNTLATRHRFVILDLPDVDTLPEAHAVLGVVDGVQLVVLRGVSTKAGVRTAIEAVNAADARLLGAVLQAP